jgi:elongation factor G
MAAEAPVRAAAPAARRPAAVVSAASRLLLGQRPFMAPSASRSRFVAGRAAVSSLAAGLRPRLRKPRLSVVAMAGNGE